MSSHISEAERAGMTNGNTVEKSSEIAGHKASFQDSGSVDRIEVALLTGGGDRPYAFGLGTQLISKGVVLDLIGSDDLDCPEFRVNPRVNFLNLRGDQQSDVSFGKKVLRVLVYYLRLLRYALTSKPKIFHILWNNKFETFDRTLLMLYYKLLGKSIVLTVHNVNARIRDNRDTALNRLTLRFQYHCADHIFVHSEQMRTDLLVDFAVPSARVTVIPFGINNSVPNTQIARIEARQCLGIQDEERTVLFFGNIAPYKGLEYLVAALRQLWDKQNDYRLIIAGWPKNCEKYWSELRRSMQEDIQKGRVLLKEEYIPDEDTEIYFKAADVLALPYRYIYQSGVLFLGYSFGLPVLAADVGPLKEEIVEGETGFIFKPEDSADLARAIETYFASHLFANLANLRRNIMEFAAERHSWEIVGQATMSVYEDLVHPRLSAGQSNHRSKATSSGAQDPF
jgi:glycosyltransferase involved in cell wall biosynthesis